jgi:hypothetical protein
MCLIVFACSRSEETVFQPAWVVTEQGFGPLHIGMTAAEAGEAIGTALASPPPGFEQCYIVRPENEPGDIAIMIVDGRVARVDVVGEFTSTAAGARVGDTEARIEMLYSGKIQKLPHKYTEGGRYLIVGSEEATSRIVFETDGKTVTRYRAGKRPEVDWVEGCS